jgi:hypothetical protein
MPANPLTIKIAKRAACFENVVGSRVVNGVMKKTKGKIMKTSLRQRSTPK